MSKREQLLSKICPQCGKEFSYIKSKERKYCSKECFYKSKQTGTEIICDNCGKSFYRRQYHIDRQKSKGQNSFCCTQCQNEYLHKQKYEIRKCEVCGQEFEASKLSTKRFCSNDCQIKWQTTRVQELNPKFTSILTSCTYCGKEHFVKPYKFKQQTNFFCSKECRQAWYSEVYSQREDWKEESRRRILQQFQNNSFNTETIPQKIINGILEEIGVNYVREKVFEFYAVDNYLSDFNLIIEVQGDYWHANPIKFISNLTDIQYNRIGKDKSKHSYFKNQYNIEILYLWETDILKNKEVCIELIKEYINSYGILHNYHSFNYCINNGNLLLNNNIIIPYQDMNIEQYKQILIS